MCGSQPPYFPDVISPHAAARMLAMPTLDSRPISGDRTHKLPRTDSPWFFATEQQRPCATQLGLFGNVFPSPDPAALSRLRAVFVVKLFASLTFSASSRRSHTAGTLGFPRRSSPRWASVERPCKLTDERTPLAGFGVAMHRASPVC